MLTVLSDAYNFLKYVSHFPNLWGKKSILGFILTQKIKLIIEKVASIEVAAPEEVLVHRLQVI